MLFRHDEEFTSHSQRRSIKINLNGEFGKGKELHMESDWTFPDFLNACSLRLDAPSSLKRVFTVDGNDIDDCMMIEDNDILFLSNGDDFIPPLTDSTPNLSWDSTVPSTLSGFKIGEVLGRGGFGEVRLGEHHLTGERVALKFLRKSEIISMGAAERTTTEIQCLSALKHAHIIRMQQHLESPQYFVLVFELMVGGDLYNFLLNRQKSAIDDGSMISAFHYALPEDEARHVFAQIVGAVGYAHNQHICHRDLKLENILLKSANLSCVKIADFGLSAFYRPGAMMKSSCGTLSFLAPEVFAGTSNAGPPLDVWALGVILFAILCGRLPFEGPDLAGTKRPRDAVIRSRIMKGQCKIEEGLSPEAKDLVRRMLRVDAPIRASVPEIFSHVWTRTASTYDASTASTRRERDQQASPFGFVGDVTGALLEDTIGHIDSGELYGEATLTGPSSTETDYDPDDSVSVDISRVMERLQASTPLVGKDSNRVDPKYAIGSEKEKTAVCGRSTPVKSTCASPHSHLRDSKDRDSSPFQYDSEGEGSPKEPLGTSNSVVLMPLRRTIAAADRDSFSSPLRPRTATEEDLLFSARPRSDSLDLLYNEKDGSKSSADAFDDEGHPSRSSRSSLVPSRRIVDGSISLHGTPPQGARKHPQLVVTAPSWTAQMTDFKLEGKSGDNSEPFFPSAGDRRTSERHSEVHNSPCHSARKSALHFAGSSSLRNYGGSPSHHHGPSPSHSPSANTSGTPERAGTARSSRFTGRLSGGKSSNESTSPHHGYDSSPSRKSLPRVAVKASSPTSLTKCGDVSNFERIGDI